MIDDLLDDVRVVALPLVTRFRGIDVRETALLHGPAGWAEFAPFVEYDDAEAAVWLAAAVAQATEPAPPPVRSAVPVNATVPAVAAHAVDEVLARFPGCRTAKVKVAEHGRPLQDDVDRVAAVRAAMGPAARIRVDANGAWSVDAAVDALTALAPYDLEYAEQPCATVDELVELRRRAARLDVPIAADESVRRAADPLAVARAGAADVLVVKVAPLGGPRRALEIVAEAGLPVVVSSALESSVGLAAGVAFAAALPELQHDCGLATAALLAADVTAAPLLPVDGTIDLRAVAADPDLLDRFSAAPARVGWWRDRIRRCAALLER